MRVLFVDDDAGVRRAYSKLARASGYRFDEAESGEEALHMLAAERPCPYDAIILDWFMAGISGADVLRALDADPELKNVPVIICSGADVWKLASEVKPNAALQKPFDWDRLEEILREVTTSPRGPRMSPIAVLETLIREFRRDVCNHLHRIENDVSVLSGSDKAIVDKVEHLSGEQRRFQERLNEIEEENAILRKQVRDARAGLRESSQSDLEHEAKIGTAIVEMSTFREEIEKLRGNDEKQSEALGAIVDELGIADRVRLGQSLPPGSKKKDPALAKLARENKSTLGAALASVFLVAVKIVIDYYGAHAAPTPPQAQPPMLAPSPPASR